MNNAIVQVMILLTTTQALSVVNQLVNARNDCFERIALEAMLPFEKTFRTEDTNSLAACKEMCIRAGDNCQAIAFGVHRRGNGTCQLSAEKIDSTGSRPSGTIFDPDFDLYARKTNCFDLQDNAIPLADSYDQSSTMDHGPNRPASVTGPQIMVVNPLPTSETTQYDEERYSPPSPPSTSSNVFSTNYPSKVDSTRYQPTRRPTTSSYSNQESDGYTGAGGDRIYFSHDLYPLYKYPMLYEQNYPAPNQEVYYPGGYAANVPELGDRYRPSYPQPDDSTQHDSPRPIFGLGYGNGYSYGKPVKYGSDSRPTTPVFSDSRPTPSDPGYTRPMQNHGNGNRPEYDHTTSSYFPRPGNGNSSPMSSSNGVTTRPSDGLDFSNRPDPTYASGQSSQDGNRYGRPARPPKKDGTRPGYDYSYISQEQDGNKIRNNSGQGYSDDKHIATFFNPDDYVDENRKSKILF